MILTIRKINKPCLCRACGRTIGANQYGSEVAIVLTITLCPNCAYTHKQTIFNLPTAIDIGEHEYLPTAEPIKALTKSVTKIGG